MKRNPRRQWLCALIGALAMAAGGTTGRAQQTADIILHNAKILTVDNNFSTAQAIAIRGNTIAAVGTEQQAMALRGPNTKVFDLKGRTVIPGLIHTHIHQNDEAETNYGGYIGFQGMKAYPINWRAVRTVQDALNQVRGVMEKYKFPPGEWIYFGNAPGGGGGGGEGGGSAGASEKVMLDGMNRYELDKVTPNNPVVMGFTWPNVNGVLVNSKAIEIIWAKHGDFFKKYGRYWIDNTGQPEGHLESPGLRWALAELPEPDPWVMAPIFKMANDEVLADGMTTISTRLPVYAEQTFKYMEELGTLQVRMAFGFETYFGRTDFGPQGLKEAGALMGKGTNWVWPISAAPSAIDGSGNRMCVATPRIDPTSNLDAWWGANGQCLNDIEYKGPKGAPISANYFNEFLEIAARDGARLANTHAAGDRSVKLVLNMMEQYQQRYGPNATKNWALDHCRLVDPADMPRAAKLGLMFSCEFSLGGEAAAKMYGERVAHSFPSPAKTMLKNGVIVSNEMGGFEGLETSITRKDRNGKVWGPHERLTREEALIVSTRNASKYVLKDDKIGTLEPGKFADLVVLDRDYMTIPEDDISEMKSLWTMVDGKPVFADPKFVEEYGEQAVTAGTVVSTSRDLRLRRKSAQGIARR
ncbi:MAG TPA: amidohydrolase family protein, partial [Terriglobia bacterium]|nr:amidohydrolase family protein [Terriglobia bacterium]